MTKCGPIRVPIDSDNRLNEEYSISTNVGGAKDNSVVVSIKRTYADHTRIGKILWDFVKVEYKHNTKWVLPCVQWGNEKHATAKVEIIMINDVVDVSIEGHKGKT